MQTEFEIIEKFFFKKSIKAYKGIGDDAALFKKDDDNLLPYEILDPILYGYIECYIGDFDEFKKTANLPEEVKVWAKTPNAKVQYDRMISLVDRTEFKRRQAAPGIKVCSVAFGTGRRVPIVKKLK